MSKEETFICIRDCYHGNHLYHVGDKLLPGHTANKHFAPGSEAAEAMANAARVALTPGDDTRSTTKIRAELFEKYGLVLPEQTPRKEVWAAWKLKASQDGGSEVKIAPAEQAFVDDAAPKGVVLIEKKFSEMTPDDIENTTAQSIKDTVLARFKNELNITGASKKILMKRAIDLEKKAVGPMAA